MSGVEGFVERFDVEREVGRGASGVVFRATHRPTGSRVALKVLLLTDADAGELARLTTEGELLSGLRHPSIVEVVDFGSVGEEAVIVGGQRFEAGTPYLAMEWLEGQDLARTATSAPLDLRAALECARQIAGALAVAHAAGIAHRDVKPSNVFLLARGESEAPLRAKLLDFGIASADAFTSGVVGGTPAYMAPEQARGDAMLDVRCDVYSLGAMLFEFCAGRPPHTGASSIATLARLASTPAPRLSELLGDVPESLDDLVAEMLSLEWRERPESREVEARLAAISEDPSLPTLHSMSGEGRDSPHSSASRLLTTLVALQLARGPERDARIAAMREVGAEAVRLGKDAVVAFFGARRTRGGEAAKALEIGKQLAEAGAAVGVATGRAQVQLARPVGEVVDKASALAREAKGGQLLADESTVELARATYDFEPLSDRPASSAWVVGRASMVQAVPPVGTPFVGRDADLAAVIDAFKRCVDARTPVAISVSGPPGIGKSRLAREFLARVDALVRDDAPQTAPSKGMPDVLRSEAPAVRIVRVGCESYGRARALGTAGDALAALLGLEKGARRSEVESALAPLALVNDEGQWLARLLAGEPFEGEAEASRARDVLYLAMTELTLKVVGHEPCVFVLEDVHWSDPESVAWFDHLLHRTAGRPLCVMALARPSFWKEHPNGFRGKGNVQVELRPLSRQATMDIARSLLGCLKGDPKLERISKQAAGSPLFAEELARVMASGREVGVVPTIEAAVQISLDVLDPAARDALTRMSVFGLASWESGLEAVGVTATEEVLARLVESEIVVAIPQSRFPGTREFRFKHALVRDVVHGTAGDSLRRELHARVAAWLASVGNDAATVAEHFDLGGLHGEAAGFWETAARRALAANALRDALKMADRALTYAEALEDSFRRASLMDEIHSRLDERAAERAEAIEAMRTHATDEASEVRTMGASARYDHARSAGASVDDRLLEVVRRAGQLGLHDEEARCAATLATRHAFAGELARAEEDAHRLLALGEARGIATAPIDAWQTLAVVRQARGELASALEARRSAASSARAAGLKNREAMLTINVGFALTTIGAREEARRAIEDGIFMAEQVGSIGTVRLGRMLLLGWAAHFGADATLDVELAEPRASADEAAIGGWVGQDRVTLGMLFYRGCELLRGGAEQLPRARALLSKAAQTYRATENRDLLPVALGSWAESERRLGEPEKAEQLAREAAELVEAGAPCLLNEAVIYLALHGSRLDRGDFVGAEEAIGRAMPALERRLAGLKGTSYVQAFLRLPDNARLLETAEALGCTPPGVESLGR
ncbi:MAG: protein kinase [Deltaproteobacteria bacterium]|nr:protein kinase [Deltaproteobacteria bacterium]